MVALLVSLNQKDDILKNMKTEKNILIVFLLNFFFSIFEFIGGSLTGSVAIASDAIHDFGDAISVGISYFLEKKSKKRPNLKYTYGYARYSTLGALITTIVLACGATFMLIESAKRLFNPININHTGMLIFATIGVIVNCIAVYLTREKINANQRAVNLHTIEDVLGWVVVLIGAIIIQVTDLNIIDPILSIIVASVILIIAIRNLKPIMAVFLEVAPDSLSLSDLKRQLNAVEGVINIHHIHLWNADEQHTCITMHVVITKKAHPPVVKQLLRNELAKHHISHAVIEIESEQEKCSDQKHRHIPIHPHHH